MKSTRTRNFRLNEERIVDLIDRKRGTVFHVRQAKQPAEDPIRDRSGGWKVFDVARIRIFDPSFFNLFSNWISLPCR